MMSTICRGATERWRFAPPRDGPNRDSRDLRGDLGNDPTGKVRDDPLALPVHPGDLALDFAQQADAVFGRRFIPAHEPLEANGQTIEFRPFKSIHLRHLTPVPITGASVIDTTNNCNLAAR